MPLTRAQLTAHVRSAHERFRVRVGGVRWYERNTIAAAARAMALELEPVEFDKSVALRELAELLEVERPPAPEPVPKYSLPPDMEGDEFLLERMKRHRPAPEGDPR